MIRNKALALILAGGAGSRLGTLTEERAKPAMPFAGIYRLIDFSLSNCMHSGISDVWIIEQYQPHSLNEHLSNGRPWDLDRTYGGLQVLPPYISKSDEGGFAEGNADAIYRHRNFIREFNPDILLVLSADHIYKLDFRKVIEHHLEMKAGLTMVTTRVPLKEANRFGTVEVNNQGRVINFEYKPEQPKSELVTTEIFAYNTAMLLETLDKLTDENANETEDNKKDLKDFGHELVPQFVKEGQACEYPFDGYWKDVGTIVSYWQAHMDLLEDKSELALDDERWPILTLGIQRLPARVFQSAHIDNSLISPGTIIRGEIINSIIGPGTIVEEGAIIKDSILMSEVKVKTGAKLNRVIIDDEAHIGNDVSVGWEEELSSNKDISEEQITLIQKQYFISKPINIPAGTQLTAKKANIV
jgi:glucose-1-phosphate adenylyltransferase